VATFQPSHEFGRVLAAFDGFQPDRSDPAGALICLLGVAVSMYAR
jgi:drug/metabolite transporter superfamily protein YnfA